MVLELILTKGELLLHEIPITVPPVPVEERLLMVLEEIVAEVAVFTVEPMVIPVIAPCPVILVTVLLERLETPFQ